MSNQYNIKIENFEGPMDLLFHLIEKNKIDIYDIPIALITEQYMDYIQTMEQMDLDVTSEFLVMAATLLHIKSKMLLPNDKSLGDEELDEDPREELVARLLEYKKYKEVVPELKEREKRQQMVFYKLPELIEVENTDTQLVGLSVDDLVDAFKKILERSADEEMHNANAFSKLVNRETISVAKKVRVILKSLKNSEAMNFINLFEKSSKIDKIATFLAVLELIKLKRIIIVQGDNFGEIMIYKNKEFRKDSKTLSR